MTAAATPGHLRFGALLIAAALAPAAPAIAVMPLQTPFFTTGPQAALETAIRGHDGAALQRALSQGADVNARGKLDVTPLMIAVDVQDLAAVRTLLAAGALANAKAADRNGPVSLAAKSYRAPPHGRDILVAVVRGGGDPDTRQPDDDPVLMQMVLAHDAAGLTLMKALGADLDTLDRGGDPFIANVAMSADWDMVWALLELGAAWQDEQGHVLQPLSQALGLRYPAADSPLYPYKLKVWQFLREHGAGVAPLRP